MLTALREPSDVCRLKTGESCARRDGTPVLICISDRTLELALPHPWPDEDGLAVAGSLPLKVDSTQVWLPGEVDPGTLLQHREGVLDVTRVRTRVYLFGVVAGVGHDVLCPVLGLRELLTWFREENVAQDDASNGRVRIDR